MSTLERRADELSSEIERNRRQDRGPLQEVRDFRICPGPQERARSQDSPARREPRRRRRRWHLL